MASRVSGSSSSTAASAPSFGPGMATPLAHELVAEALAVRLDQPGGRVREMDRQDEAAGARRVVQEPAARLRGLLLVPVEYRRPVGLAALQGMVHHVADH